MPSVANIADNMSASSCPALLNDEQIPPLGAGVTRALVDQHQEDQNELISAKAEAEAAHSKASSPYHS